MTAMPITCTSSVSVRCALLLVGLVALALPAAAQPPVPRQADQIQLLAKQEDQERARVMTRALLDGVLKLQLRQLEENSLTDLPLYRDIQLMRSHLQEIVDGEMPKVVDLLATAHAAPPDQRDANLIAARQMIREVVVRLSTERQSLLRRLKAAELTEQVQRLIELQANVRTTTQKLGEENQSRQPAAILQTQEDQRDVRELFLHLVETLDDVRTWGGPIADSATNGLRLLKAADVGQHLDQVDVQLSAVAFPAAATEQTAVLNGLQDLIRLLHKQQGTQNTAQNTLVVAIQSLAQKQGELQAATRRLADDASADEQLVQDQLQLRQELARLSPQLPDVPAASRLVQGAEAAAATAAEKLFSGENPSAAAQQGEVIGHLAALEQLLLQPEPTPQADLSATELAQQTRELQAARTQLEQTQAKQSEVAQQAARDATVAASAEREVATQLEQIQSSAKLPENTSAELAHTITATKSAAEALASAASAAEAAQSEQLAAVDRALDHALATATEELEELARRTAAVKIGELARAAEVLERSAAAERAVADELGKAATAGPAESSRLQELASRQQEVAEITQNLSEGLQEIAPQTSEEVRAATQLIQQTHQQLSAAQTASDEQRQATMAALQPSAKAAAASLSQAASQLRKEIAAAATELQQQSAKQAAALAAARANVEAATEPDLSSLSERIANLEEARNQAAQAKELQQRASGRPEAAQALELARSIAAARQSQAAADRIARQFEQGELATPLQAATSQQATADLVASLEDTAARQTTAMPESAARKPMQEAAAALKSAEEAATEAARATLQGNLAAAAAARQRASDSLQAAASHADQSVEQSQQGARTAPGDADAQRQTSAAASRAAALAQTDAPTAAAPLTKAAEQSATAESQLAENNSAMAQSAQEATEAALQAATQELNTAIEQLMAQQRASLQRQAARAAELSQPAAMVDRGAATALENIASTAAHPQNLADAAQLATAFQSAQTLMQRAVASLALKEQEVRRDEAVAAALAQLAQRQQQAADVLAAQRDQLANASPTSDMPVVDAQQAQAAAAQFSEAQLATGQGAVELSGQEQVANPALRQALELARSLLLAQMAGGVDSETLSPLTAAGNAPMVPAQGSTPPTESAAAANSSTNPSNNSQSATRQQTAPAGTSSAPDTGFVPQSPELTAKMLAGPQLSEAMQQAAGAAQQAAAAQANASTSPNAQPLETNSSSQSATGEPQTNQGSNMQAARSASGAAENEGIKDGPLQDQPEGTDLGQSTAGQRAGDADVGTRQFLEQAWFAKLPPELRKSLQAGTQQRAPKAYEDRLRRYFQSAE